MAKTKKKSVIVGSKEWFSSIAEMVDKDPGKPHCQAFLDNPTI
jgi:hypothetical protein